MGGQLLIAGDSPEAGRVWAYALRGRGHRAEVSGSVEDALRLAVERLPDLAVIDVYTQAEVWLDACSKLRRHGVNPIILLAPAQDESLILRAYERGVDEVAVKPISPLVLLAKVESWLRRAWTIQTSSLDPLTVGSLTLTPERRELCVSGNCVYRLTNLEVRLLQSLMAHPERAMSGELLIERVWGTDGGDADMLKNLVYRLRRKIEPENARQHFIVTVPGQGYRLRVR